MPLRRFTPPALFLAACLACAHTPVARAASAVPAAPEAPAQAAGAWGVDQLMSALAQRKSGRVRFSERKYLAMLERPVDSTGELVFVAPDHLEKRTLTPKPENMVLDGDMMTIERGGKSYVMPLQNYPELAAFIESIRATLAGNRDALERYYRLRVDGVANRWALTLVPTDARMAAHVKQVRIDGVRDNLSSVEIVQADGDRSVMQIRPAP